MNIQPKPFVLNSDTPRLCVAVAILLTLAMGSAQAATVAEQREAFLEVYPEVERGNWQPAREKQSLLADYVLWPDLRATYFRASLSSADRDDAAIRAFLDQHPALKPARELRYRYALQLAAENRMAEYLEIYEEHFRDLAIAKLDCHALNARLLAGDQPNIAKHAEQLWLVGKSQAKECDPLFDYLRSNSLLDLDLYRQRFELAIEARQFSLARYLSKPLESRYRDEATRWLSAQNRGEEFVRSHADRADSEAHRRQLVYAVEQIAYKDPGLATELWQIVADQYAFSTAQASATDRHLALWWARRHLPDASQVLVRLPADAVDTEVRRWRVRTNLREQNWNGVVSNIEAMQSDERHTEQWRYWRAYALLQTGRTDEAEGDLLDLAGERGYYGFLAADEMRRNYQFSHADIPIDEETIATLGEKIAFIRARELFYVGLEGRGRSEWDAAVARLRADEKAQAVVLAQRWGWHSRAIATAATAGEFDDLHIRYPLPYKISFNKYSSAAQVHESWAYGIARSESLFMRDVRSSAGAIGLMQLMPATGKSTAREISHPYAGRTTLTDPASNIRLGTYYLGKMYQRFGKNMVLATAAYNAGPYNVDQWLPDSGTLDARIWVENIPYSETRSYVRRVLETAVIFNWRLTGRVQRLSNELAAITAPRDRAAIVPTD